MVDYIVLHSDLDIFLESCFQTGESEFVCRGLESDENGVYKNVGVLVLFMPQYCRHQLRKFEAELSVCLFPLFTSSNLHVQVYI